MPEDRTYGQQKYDLNELENAAAFAVTEVEKMTEIFTQATKMAVTVHSPEATWGDPVRLVENVPHGGLLVSIMFGTAKTALFMPGDDAALYSALLAGFSGQEVTRAIRKGLNDEKAEVLMGLVNQVFIPAGGKIGPASVIKGGPDILTKIQGTVGATFLGVRVTLSLEGYSDGYMYRLYDNVFVEKNFRAEAANIALETQVLPTTSSHRAITPEEPQEKEKAPGEREEMVERLVRIPVTLRVMLAGRRMKFRDVMKLLPGEVIEFDKRVAEPAEVMVNSHVIAGAEVVRSGQHYGVKLRKIASIKERLKSLGKV
jgi:flagellar motor switch protein FliN